MLQNCTFDFTKLNPVSSDLHLGIDSSNILYISVTFHSNHITGSVKPTVIFTYRKWICDKYSCCLFREIVISSCDLSSGMAKFTGCPDRKSVQILIYDIAADVPLGFSYWYVIILSVNLEFCRRYCIFGRSISVDHLIGPFSVMLEFLAAESNKFKIWRIIKQLYNQLTHLCRERCCRNFFILYKFPNSNCIFSDALRQYIKHSSCSKWNEKIQHGCIKAEACEFCNNIFRSRISC